MTDSHFKKQDIICHCTCTTKTDILILVKKGENTIEKIAYQTGATAGCGGCEDTVNALLIEFSS